MEQKVKENKFNGLLAYLEEHPETKEVFFNKEKTDWQFHQHNKRMRENEEHDEKHPVKMSREAAIKYAEGLSDAHEKENPAPKDKKK